MNIKQKSFLCDPTSRWVDSKSRKIVRGVEASAASDTHVLFDGKLLELASMQVSTSADGSVYRFRAFYDEWRIIEFYRYRPLIYFGAFGSEKYLEQLELSLTSLDSFGHYDGDVMIITDRGKDEIRRYLPENFVDRSHVWNYFPIKKIDFYLARYRLSSWQDAFGFRPILYADTDVIFDAPIEDVLSQIAIGENIYGQGEASHRLATVLGVGSALFSAENIDVGDEIGFCSGIIGLSDLWSQSDLMASIIDGVTRYFNPERQDAGWYDQPAANYIVRQLGGANLDLLYERIRWGGRNALHGGVDARGFVHLWGGSKEDDMRDMIGMFSNAPARVPKLWTVYDQGQAVERSDLKPRQSDIAK